MQMMMMINENILFYFIKDVTTDETSDDGKLKSCSEHDDDTEE